MAKDVRVKTHPARLRRQGGPTPEEEKKLRRGLTPFQIPCREARYDKELRLKI